MTHEEIKFEEIKNKILNDFVPVLKAYGEFKKIDINDSDINNKLQELEKFAKRFFISLFDEIEILYVHETFQFKKEKGEP